MRRQAQDIIYDLTAFLSSPKANIYTSESVTPPSCYSLEEFGPPFMETEERPALFPVLEIHWSCQSLCRVVLLVQIWSHNSVPFARAHGGKRWLPLSHTVKAQKDGLTRLAVLCNTEQLKEPQQSNQHPGRTGKRLSSSLLILGTHSDSMWEVRGEIGRRRCSLNHNKVNHLGTSKPGSGSHTWSFAIVHWVLWAEELQRKERVPSPFQSSKALPHFPNPPSLLPSRALCYHPPVFPKLPALNFPSNLPE